MALLQALLAFIGRSAGKILQAVFGWAVRALFGTTAGARQMLLTGVVAAAALWPLLLLGVAFPRFAAFAIAFVPLPSGFDERWLRAAWVALALLAPLAVGVALAREGRGAERREPAWKATARGFPLTLGLATAFWLSFVSVPLQRLAAAARRESDAYLPLVTSPSSYPDAAERILLALREHGFEIGPAVPGFWTHAPLDVLRKLGGDALRGFVPERLAYFRGPTLVAALYPSGLLLRGRERDTAHAHGLAAEVLTPSEAQQTVGAEAQRLERQIQQVWHVLDREPEAHRGSALLGGRLREIADELVRADLLYDDWQILYRESLQLDRALRGAPQLLSRDTTPKETAMQNDRTTELSTAELLREITAKSALLARKEIDLARAEMRSDIAAELGMVKALGAAGALALVGVNGLLVAAVFALTPFAPGWLAALGLGGVLLVAAAITGAMGWSRRVKRPLQRTRRTLEEDVQWAKERLA